MGGRADMKMGFHRWVWTIGLAAAALVVGCGRPTLPGQHFRDQKVETTQSPAAESPLPEQPYYEWGDEKAKVRVVAFFPIDEDHKELMDLVRGLAEQYPGKVYVKYVDYRTGPGSAMFSRAGMAGRGVMLNSKTSLDIEVEPRAYTVDFVQEMGRYWTADDLKKAVAQEVARAYGEAASVRE